MIVRNEIPLLEYDDKSPEVIAPDHDWTAGRLPEKCLFAFLGESVHRYAEAHDARVAETLITVFSEKQKIWSIIDWKKAVWWLRWNVPRLLRAQGNAELYLGSFCLQQILWRMFMYMMRGDLEWNHMKKLFCLDSMY